MKQQTEKKLQANLKAINNDFNTVIFADIEVKFKLMELETIRILIDDCERLINEDAGDYADGVDDAMDEFDEDWQVWQANSEKKKP